MNDNLLILHRDVLNLIFLLLDEKDIINCSYVCKSLNDIYKNDIVSEYLINKMKSLNSIKIHINKICGKKKKILVNKYIDFQNIFRYETNEYINEYINNCPKKNQYMSLYEALDYMKILYGFNNNELYMLYKICLEIFGKLMSKCYVYTFAMNSKWLNFNSCKKILTSDHKNKFLNEIKLKIDSKYFKVINYHFIHIICDIIEPLIHVPSIIIN